MSKLKTNEKRGDSLIEVVLAFSIFAIVTIVTVTAMNNGMTTAWTALERTLSRSEIDAQAETLRFIQSSFAAESNKPTSDQKYGLLWHAIIGNALTDASKVPSQDTPNCDDLYNPLSTDPTVYSAKAFVLNSRKIGTVAETYVPASDANDANDIFRPTPLYPRVLYTTNSVDETTDDELLKETRTYTKVGYAEGIYITAVAEKTDGNRKPYFYDFHIYTCWVPAGADRSTTAGTIVRLFNPEFK